MFFQDTFNREQPKSGRAQRPKADLYMTAVKEGFPRQV